MKGMCSLHSKGSLFAKPPAFDRENQMEDPLEKLKGLSCSRPSSFLSISRSSCNFETKIPPIYSIYVDCNNSHGPKLIHASLNWPWMILFHQLMSHKLFNHALIMTGLSTTTVTPFADHSSHRVDCWYFCWLLDWSYDCWWDGFLAFL